ncbi:MAG: cold-shock protein [Janthinobacterium lividum]
MAKPQANFSKQENEKKRLQKQKEKEERRVARLANKGQSDEDMIAYVDEDGNITATPPDPNRKKKEISLESILVGVPKQEDRPQEDTQRTGTVSFFNDSKGYGFIKDLASGESIFVHVNSLGGLQLKEGNKVTFETEAGQKGPVAVRVKMSA